LLKAVVTQVSAEIVRLFGDGACGSRDQIFALQALATQMARNGTARDNPQREVFARLGDKWSTLLLLILKAGPMRHGLLRRIVDLLADEDHISPRILTLCLRALERDGFVDRAVFATLPPSVEYSLTELGRELVLQQEQMRDWVTARAPRILAARATYEARED